VTALSRSELPAAAKTHLAVLAAGGQGSHGSLSAVARQFGVSRPTVYAAASEATDVLTTHFSGSGEAYGARSVNVCVDSCQLVRAVVALRAVAPNSIRCIEELLGVLYPGVELGYGSVQRIASEAEARATVFNTKADLCGISSAALDEMFSQGDPVLAGVDLDSGYLFALSLCESRSGEDWQQVLQAAKDQGVNLEVVVKDAAKGISAGVSAVFPAAEQRDDCFHALYEMNKVRRTLEARAYGAIQREFEAQQKLDAARWSVNGERSRLAQKLRWAVIKANKAIELHDAFETAARAAAEAMEWVELQTGLVRTPEKMRQDIENAASQMLALDDGRCKKAGRYIYNRAPGLAMHMQVVNDTLNQLAHRYDSTAVAAACLIHRLATDIKNGRRPWDTANDKRRLRLAIAQLESSSQGNADRLLGLVDVVAQKRNRASSAIEGFNAALRPFLYVHKGVTQGFLELFRARYNLKTRRWGRLKGTSAHEKLSGERVDDWLTALGYPPSPTLH